MGLGLDKILQKINTLELKSHQDSKWGHVEVILYIILQLIVPLLTIELKTFYKVVLVSLKKRYKQDDRQC